jgi:prepilin-type N-terminal cleavage/methylation domain-containing protein
MKTRPPQSSSQLAFTLIELLTVIAIIAILMGLLFPALGAVRENARRVQAKTDVTNIVAAVKQYYTEYGKYPSLQDPAAKTGATATQDLWCGDEKASAAPLPNSALFNTLRNIPVAPNTNYLLNPRKIVFMESKTVANPEDPRAGFLDKEPTGTGASGGDSGGGAQKGCFFDPWGKQYNIMIDSNHDDQLDLDQVYKDITGPEERPRFSVGSFSTGKDGVVGDKKFEGRLRNGTTLSDDVISWQ